MLPFCGWVVPMEIDLANGRTPGDGSGWYKCWLWETLRCPLMWPECRRTFKILKWVIFFWRDHTESSSPAESSSVCSHKGFFADFARGEVHLRIKYKNKNVLLIFYFSSFISLSAVVWRPAVLPLTLQLELQAALGEAQLRSEASERELLVITSITHFQGLQGPVQVSARSGDSHTMIKSMSRGSDCADQKL